MKRVASWVVVVIAGGLSSPGAWGHHVVSEFGIAPILPRRVIEVGLEAGATRQLLGDATWQMVAPTLELALAERFSIWGRLPVARVETADGRTATGLSDADVGTKLRFFSTPHGEFTASGGVAFELPVGDHEAGLGGSHFACSPFAALSTASTPTPTGGLVLVALAFGRFSFGGEDHRQPPGALHGSLIAPHTASELGYRASAAYTRDRGYASAGLEAIQILDGAPGQTWGPLTARGELGFMIRPTLRLALGGDLPLAGAIRTRWRARSGLAWLF